MPRQPDSPTARQPDSPTVPDRTQAWSQPTLPPTGLTAVKSVSPTGARQVPDRTRQCLTVPTGPTAKAQSPPVDVNVGWSNAVDGRVGEWRSEMKGGAVKRTGIHLFACLCVCVVRRVGAALGRGGGCIRNTYPQYAIHGGQRPLAIPSCSTFWISDPESGRLDFTEEEPGHTVEHRPHPSSIN